MLSQEKIITMADRMFPGQESFSMVDMLQLIKEAEATIFNEKAKPTKSMYKLFVRFLFSKNLSNRDAMLLLTAMKGGGKSSAAIMLAREWCHLIGQRWDPKKYIAYTNADLVRKIETLPEWSPLIADESVRFCSSEDWAKRENKELVKKMAQIREKHFFFMLCFPLKIKKVQKAYLESFVNYWIEIYARGKSAIFVRDSNPVFDSWRLDDFRKIGAYSEFTPDDVIKQKLREHPNFWKFMRIPKVPNSIYANYKKVRESNVYRDSDDVFKSVTKEDIYRSALLMALNDVMSNDQNLSLGRVLLHVKNEYDITIPKKEMQVIIKDAMNMISAVRESAIE